MSSTPKATFGTSERGGFAVASSIAVSAMILGACAFSNTGAVDYRRAEVLSDAERVQRSDDAGRGLKDDSQGKARTDPDPILPVPLAWKNWVPVGSDNAIEKDNSIAIRLSQGYVRHCTEGIFSQILGGNFDSMSKGKKNCDVAVVVNAFEMENGKDFDFSPEGVKKGRLVYFSGDTEQEQFLNFNNMPIYGPITYNGGPIALDIHIMEVDADSEQLKAILGTLASLGKTAYPPAAPVLSVLDSLGKSLLDGAQDDTDFRYTVVFDPKGGRPSPYATLEAGAYAFVREENREAKTPWFKLRYDENTGRLFYRDPPANATPEQRLYRENTYLTLNVVKGLEAKNLDLQQNTFGAFRAKLDEIDKAQAARFALVGDELQKQVRDVIAQRGQISAFDNARQALRKIEDANNVLARRYGTAKLLTGYAEQSLADTKEAIKEACEGLNAGDDCCGDGASDLAKELCRISGLTAEAKGKVRRAKEALGPDVRPLSKQEISTLINAARPLADEALSAVKGIVEDTAKALEGAKEDIASLAPRALSLAAIARNRIGATESRSLKLVQSERLLYFEAREAARWLLGELRRTVVFYRTPTTEATPSETTEAGDAPAFSREQTDYLLQRLRQLADLRKFDDFKKLTVDDFPQTDDGIDALIELILPKNLIDAE